MLFSNSKIKPDARVLENPRIDKISFKTFRHWKGTKLYSDTKDILLVKYARNSRGSYDLQETEMMRGGEVKGAGGGMPTQIYM